MEVCKNLGRYSINIDKEFEYAELAQKRLDLNQKNLNGGSVLEVLNL